MDIRKELVEECRLYLQLYTVGKGIYRDILDFLDSSLAWSMRIRAILMKAISLEMKREGDDSSGLHDMFEPMILMEEKIVEAMAEVFPLVEYPRGKAPSRKYDQDSLSKIVEDIYGSLTKLDKSSGPWSVSAISEKKYSSLSKGVFKASKSGMGGVGDIVILDEEDDTRGRGGEKTPVAQFSSEDPPLELPPSKCISEVPVGKSDEIIQVEDDEIGGEDTPVADATLPYTFSSTVTSSSEHLDSIVLQSPRQSSLEVEASLSSPRKIPYAPIVSPILSPRTFPVHSGEISIPPSSSSSLTIITSPKNSPPTQYTSLSSVTPRAHTTSPLSPRSPVPTLSSPKTESTMSFSKKVVELVEDEREMLKKMSTICTNVNIFVVASIKSFLKNTAVENMLDKPQEGTSTYVKMATRCEGENKILTGAIRRCDVALASILKSSSERNSEVVHVRLIGNLRDDTAQKTRSGHHRISSPTSLDGRLRSMTE